MSYKFNPMNNEKSEIVNEVKLMPSGNYDFEVIRSSKQTSSKGNEMAKLQLKLTNENNETFYLYDYLVFADNTFSQRKIKHFCEAVGLANQYKTGVLDEDMEGLTGRAEVGIEPQKEKPQGGFYPERNAIVDYIKSENPESADFDQDKDIPF